LLLSGAGLGTGLPLLAVVPKRHQDREWFAAEVYTHILDMNERGSAAIRGILDSGVIPATISDVMTGGSRSGLKDAEDYWAAYQAVRESLLARVLEAGGDGHLEAKITHSMFGDFSWREWLLFMRVHDLDHMRQLDKNATHFTSRAG
jgi:hypothetical protein